MENKKTTWERNRSQLDKLKPVKPWNNGWWFYEYFKNYLTGRTDVVRR